MSDFTIYHNPRCSKSRQTMALLEQNGVNPNVVLYLEHPPSEEKLRELVGQLGIAPRDLLRRSEDAYKERNLKDSSLSDDELVRAMVEEPRLIERPIVVAEAEGRAVLGRPPENVLGLL
jgi:arsenate reductase